MAVTPDTEVLYKIKTNEQRSLKQTIDRPPIRNTSSQEQNPYFRSSNLHAHNQLFPVAHYRFQLVINDSVYLNLNYSVNKSPEIATSPLHNITGHDNILSLLLLQRMKEHNLRLMQELRNAVSAGGSPRIWFAAGVAISFTLCGLVLLQQHFRRKR